MQKLVQIRSTLNDKPDDMHPREANTREIRCISIDKKINEDIHHKMVNSSKTRSGIVVAQRKCAINGDLSLSR